MNENKFLKLLIAGTILMLLGAIFGMMHSYTLFRWDLLGMCVILALTALASKRYYWAVVFVFFGILFNPLKPFYFERVTWIYIDGLLVCALLAWFWDYFNSYRKGLLFEKYILSRFSSTEWDVVTTTMDLHKKLRRIVESDANPDFVFRSRATKKAIDVECRYRSEFFAHKSWGQGVSWRREQGERYLQYGRDNNTPVYIAIGVGGNPKSPKFVSYIPIELIQKQYFHFIPKEVMERYCELPKF